MAGAVRLFLIYSWFTEGTQIVNSTLLNAYSPIQKYNLDVQEMSEFTSWLELLKSNEVEDPNFDYYSDSDSDSDSD